MLACQNGHEQCALALIKAGQSLTPRTTDGGPLMMSVARTVTSSALGH